MSEAFTSHKAEQEVATEIESASSDKNPIENDGQIEFLKQMIRQLSESAKQLAAKVIEQLQAYADKGKGHEAAEKFKELEKKVIEAEKEALDELANISDQAPSEKSAREESARIAEQASVPKISEIVRQLNEKSEELKSIELLPCLGVLADTNHIENQEIEVIRKPDERKISLIFKLTKDRYEEMRNKCKNQSLETSVIRYGLVKLAACWVKTVGNVSIRISTGHQETTGVEVRSSLGLVEVDIPEEEAGDDNADIDEKLDRIFREELGISEGVSGPGLQAEKEYKHARYKWQHKLEEVPEKIEEKLSRQEVMPGYFTFVEPDRYREYQKKSPYAVYHHLMDPDSLPKIIRAGGLLSTHERYRRGLMQNGMSSIADLKTGGADSVFTRIATKNSLNLDNKGNMNMGVNLIFEPDLLDRTDWYAYGNDAYGSTFESTFSNRLEPQELLSRTLTTSNEQMFRNGIPTSKIKAITCTDKDSIRNLVNILSENGISEINGKPVESMIILADTLSDFIRISASDSLTGERTSTMILAEKDSQSS